MGEVITGEIYHLKVYVICKETSRDACYFITAHIPETKKTRHDHFMLYNTMMTLGKEDF